jgi:hypothetical protein
MAGLPPDLTPQGRSGFGAIGGTRYRDARPRLSEGSYVVRFAPAVLAGVLAVGCTTGDRSAPSAATTAGAAAPTTLRLVDRRDVRDAGAMTLSGDVFGGRAAWAAGAGDRADSVVVADLATGRRKVALTTRTGQIDWVRGHGSTLVYRELDDTGTGWTIRTHDLDSGQAETIAQSTRPSAIVPAPVVSAAAIAWIEGDAGREVVRVYDRATRRSRVALRSSVVTAVAVDGDQVFVVDGADQKRPVLTVPVAGGEPTVLIPDARAMEIRVSPTSVAYASGASLDDHPERLVLFDRATTKSVEVTDSTTTMLALGGSFVAWHPRDGSRIVAAPLGDVRRQVTVQPVDVNGPLGVDGEGEWILWGESPRGGGAGTNVVLTGRLAT